MKRYGSDKRVDGRETVGNSLERAPVGRCDTGVTRWWTVGKPLEIAWGELRWEGAIRECDDKVDGGETVGNSLGRFPLGGNGWKQRYRWTERKELRWEGAMRE